MENYNQVSWSAGRTLPKTPSDLSESDLESERPNKNQSSLFIHKLYEMASCDTHAHIFGFSEDGMSLKIRNAASLGPVLLRYFKHSNTSSFIRQLNNYGFKTISSVSNGNSVQTFAHPYFYRDGKELLDTITRKTAKNVKRCKGDIIKELQHVETEYRKRFRDMETRNTALQRKNEQLEVENKKLRMICQDFEKCRGPSNLSLEPTPLPRFPQNTLAPLFEHLINIPEPLLEVCSTASDVSRASYGEDLLMDKNGEELMFDPLLVTDNGWTCIGNDDLV